MNQQDKEARVAQARAFFKEGYGCCQSVVMAYADVLGVPAEDLARLACGLGGGVARMREVCGCVSGMAMVAGAIRPATNKREDRAANYALVQELAASYREMNGSIICRDILGLRMGQKEDSAPGERTEEYYKTRPCERLVGIAAGLLADKIFINFASEHK